MPSSASPAGGSPARGRSAPAVPSSGLRSWLAHHRGVLLVAFAFTVMADPVSSVAYAVEAALRALGGDLSLLLPTMTVVICIIAVVIANYHQLVARFPQGGGAAAAWGAAFSEGIAFVPLGALVVDFVLTIAISVAAGTSAIVAYFPAAHTIRVPLALGLLLLVAGLTWFGHWGRILFALMTLSFVGCGSALLISGFSRPAATTTVATGHTHGLAFVSVMLAFPVGMALATGVEAPSSAIAQLGQPDNDGRRFFGRVTLWLTLIVVGGLTLGPHRARRAPADRRSRRPTARRSATSRGPRADARCSPCSRPRAPCCSWPRPAPRSRPGPGCSRRWPACWQAVGERTGILLAVLGRTNRHHTPYWAGLVYLVAAAAVIVAAGGRDQELVLFYAVAVFMSFLAGLLAMLRFSWNERRLRWVA